MGDQLSSQCVCGHGRGAHFADVGCGAIGCDCQSFKARELVSSTEQCPHGKCQLRAEHFGPCNTMAQPSALSSKTVVEELRDFAKDYVDGGLVNRMCHQAADEIERLREENSALKRVVDGSRVLLAEIRTAPETRQQSSDNKLFAVLEMIARDPNSYDLRLDEVAAIQWAVRELRQPSEAKS